MFRSIFVWLTRSVNHAMSWSKIFIDLINWQLPPVCGSWNKSFVDFSVFFLSPFSPLSFLLKIYIVLSSFFHISSPWFTPGVVDIDSGRSRISRSGGKYFSFCLILNLELWKINNVPPTACKKIWKRRLHSFNARCVFCPHWKTDKCF